MDILKNLNHRLTISNTEWTPCYGGEKIVKKVLSKSPIQLPEDYITFLNSISGGDDFGISFIVDGTKFQISVWDAEAALEELEEFLETLSEEDCFRDIWCIGDDVRDLVYFYAEGKEGFGLYKADRCSTCIDGAEKVADTLTDFLVKGIGLDVPIAYRTDVAMKVYDNEYYGKVTYDVGLELWKRTTPIEIPYNGKMCSVDFYIEDAEPMYTQIKYNLDDYGITLDQIQSWQVELYKKDVLEQKELFDKYLKDPKDMMKLFEDRIIKDFYEERTILLEDETYCIRMYGEETTEKIRTADTCEKILDMVHFKELTLATNQIRIIGECEYYVDFGVSIMLDGTIYVGLEEMIYC